MFFFFALNRKRSGNGPKLADVCAAITLLTFTRSVSGRGRLFPESLIFTLRPQKTVSHDCSTFVIKYQRSHCDLCSAGGKARGLLFLLYLHNPAEQTSVEVCIFSYGKVGCFLFAYRPLTSAAAVPPMAAIKVTKTRYKRSSFLFSFFFDEATL